MKALVRLILSVLLPFCVLLVHSCGFQGSDALSGHVASHPIQLRYATRFSVDETDFGYLAKIYIEEGDKMDSVVYGLTRCDSSVLPEYAIRVSIPVRRVATNSGTLFEFLRLLEAEDCLVATCGSKYLYSKNLRDRLEQGTISSLGSSFDINAENLLAARPDVLFLSDLRDAPSVSVCPNVYNLEWKECSGLARTEWIKFFALFVDKLKMADSLYDGISDRYALLKSRVDSMTTERPTLFAAGSFGDTWYMTGGKGYMASMYRDAGADFLLSDTLVSTVTCGTEWLLANCSEADFWMNSGTFRLSDIDERLRVMKAYRSGNVFHFEKRSRSSEGMNISDFYESAVACPDVVLADLVSVIHPGLLPDYEPVYLGRCEATNNERGTK